MSIRKTAFLLATFAFITMSSSASATDFTLTSPDLKDGKLAQANFLSEPYGFGCSGGNVSPSLEWSNAPAGTKSFVLTIYDLDAPTGFGWVHWVVANIPGSVSKLPSGISAGGQLLPSGALQTRTDFGVPGYGGPCPPQGSTHRYEITLTAVSVDKLPAVTADATPALVGFFSKAQSLGQAKLTVVQGR